MDGNVKWLTVVHRKLGTDDESSTDEEVLDRVLMHYPEVGLGEKMDRLKMVEGTIVFAERFSDQGLDSVLMEDTNIGFYECEPDCWFVVGYSNEAPVARGVHAARPDLFAHRATGAGIVDALKHLYHTFAVTNGTVESLLRGSDGSGWEHVETVRIARKRLRKLRVHLMELEATRDNREEDGEEVSAEMHAQIQALDDEQTELDVQIARMVGNDSGISSSFVSPSSSSSSNFICEYTPKTAGQLLFAFTKFVLSTGELISPSVIHSMVTRGMHRTSFGPNVMPHILTLRHVLGLDGERGLFSGSFTLIYDGTLLWSDLPLGMVHGVYSFVRIVDDGVRRSELCHQVVSQKLETALDGQGGSKDGSNPTNTKPRGHRRSRIAKLFSRSTSRDVEIDADGINMSSLGASMDEFSRLLHAEHGFVDARWCTHDLVRQDRSAAHVQVTDRLDYAHLRSTMAVKGAGKEHEKLEEDGEEGARVTLWCPKLMYPRQYQQPSSSSAPIEGEDASENSNDNDVLYDHALLYRQGRFSLLAMLEGPLGNSSSSSSSSSSRKRSGICSDAEYNRIRSAQEAIELELGSLNRTLQGYADEFVQEPRRQSSSSSLLSARSLSLSSHRVSKSPLAQSSFNALDFSSSDTGNDRRVLSSVSSDTFGEKGTATNPKSSRLSRSPHVHPLELRGLYNEASNHLVPMDGKPSISSVRLFYVDSNSSTLRTVNADLGLSNSEMVRSETSRGLAGVPNQIWSWPCLVTRSAEVEAGHEIDGDIGTSTSDSSLNPSSPTQASSGPEAEPETWAYSTPPANDGNYNGNGSGEQRRQSTSVTPIGSGNDSSSSGKRKPSIFRFGGDGKTNRGSGCSGTLSSQVDHVLKDLRDMYPPCPGFSAGLLEPAVLSGLAEIYDCLVSSQCPVKETFRRLATPSRGGVWCYGRLVSSTLPQDAIFVLAVVEQCGSVSDMLYLANKAITTTFGSTVHR